MISPATSSVAVGLVAPRIPAPIGDIAYQNKAVIYDILFKASAEALTTIAADPKHLGARVGITSVLHTWGSAMTHHPHVHMIVPGGGIARDCRRTEAVCVPRRAPAGTVVGTSARA
jgi:putative transposase